MKRWRCPECHLVYTTRSDTHWRGFWATRLIILASVMGKVLTGYWLKSISRQRQQYWWLGYRRHAPIHSDWRPVNELLAAGIILATHSLTHCDVTVGCLEKLSFTDAEMAEIDKYAKESGISLWEDSIRVE